MHPCVIEELTRQREGELRRPAERYALLGPCKRRRLVKHRAGRAPAGIGLALARGVK